MCVDFVTLFASFLGTAVHTITTAEMEQLVMLSSDVNKLTGPLEFKGPILSSAPLTACVAVLTPKSLSGENATFLDRFSFFDFSQLEILEMLEMLEIICVFVFCTLSQALLFCAATLINTAVATGCDAPRCGFSIVTDGRQWRFVVSATPILVSRKTTRVSYFLIVCRPSSSTRWTSIRR